MNKLKDLRAKRAQLNKDIRAFNATISGRVMTDEENTRAASFREQSEILNRDIENAEEERFQDEMDARTITEPKPAAGAEVNERRHFAFNAYLRSGFNNLDEDTRGILKEIRALNTGTAAEGGYTVDVITLSKIIEEKISYGGVLSVMRRLPTAGGQKITWPVSTEGAVRGVIVGETENVGKSDTGFTQAELNAYKISSRVIQVSTELLQDSTFDIASYITRIARQRIERGKAYYVLNGTGTAQPKGLKLQVAPSKTLTIKATQFGFDALLALQSKIDPAYRSAPMCGWAMNDASLLKLQTVKDTQGNYIYSRDLTSAFPDRLFGKPVFIDPELPDIAATSVGAVFFGDMDNYVLREVGSPIIRRLDELYAENDMVGFLAFHRFDDILEDKASVAMLNTLATAPDITFTNNATQSTEAVDISGIGGFDAGAEDEPGSTASGFKAPDMA